MPAARPATLSPERAAALALAQADGVGLATYRDLIARFGSAQRALDAEFPVHIRQGLLEHSPQALAHLQRELLACSPSPERLAPQLRELEIPTCLIAGTDDPESLGPCRQLAALLPRAKLHELLNAGHVVNLTRPTLFNQILLEFLAEL